MKLINQNWWKYLSILILFYVLIVGLLGEVPRLAILNETIRILYFHVPMWFGMIILLTTSMVYAVKYLSGNETRNDLLSMELANVAIFLGMLGMVTGMIWANYTWGSPWSNDPRQNASAIALLIYFAYFILRGSLQDEQQRARISAIYNIFAYAAMIPLIFILPRLTDSLHPGAGGNPGFNAYDLDANLRLVFYPAVLGWTLLGYWFVNVRYRMRRIEETLEEENS